MNRLIAGSLGLCLGLPAAVFGQGPRGRMGGDIEKRFESSAPALGERLPDLEAFDADGTKVSLRKLVKGRYTVLVLGCLT